jgi:hypothetical protein
MDEPKVDPATFQWPTQTEPVNELAGFTRDMTWTGVPDTRPSWGQA